MTRLLEIDAIPRNASICIHDRPNVTPSRAVSGVTPLLRNRKFEVLKLIGRWAWSLTLTRWMDRQKLIGSHSLNTSMTSHGWRLIVQVSSMPPIGAEPQDLYMTSARSRRNFKLACVALPRKSIIRQQARASRPNGSAHGGASFPTLSRDTMLGSRIGAERALRAIHLRSSDDSTPCYPFQTHRDGRRCVDCQTS